MLPPEQGSISDLPAAKLIIQFKFLGLEIKRACVETEAGRKKRGTAEEAEGWIHHDIPAFTDQENRSPH
jgi:hypothetical protein